MCTLGRLLAVKSNNVDSLRGNAGNIVCGIANVFCGIASFFYGIASFLCGIATFLCGIATFFVASQTVFGGDPCQHTIFVTFTCLSSENHQESCEGAHSPYRVGALTKVRTRRRSDVLSLNAPVLELLAGPRQRSLREAREAVCPPIGTNDWPVARAERGAELSGAPSRA
jgi:hypothetical protein